MAPGPIRGLRYIHASIRAQTAAIRARAVALQSPSEAVGLSPSIDLLVKATLGHAKAEDVGYFPALAERAGQALLSPFFSDHEAELARFERLQAAVASCRDAEGLAQVRALAEEIHAALDAHMRREEELLWPMTEEKFSPPEQGGLMGAILQAVPKQDFPLLVPWMTSVLSTADAIEYVQMLQRVQPPEVFALSAGWIRGGVPPARWAELTAQISGLG